MIELRKGLALDRAKYELVIGGERLFLATDIDSGCVFYDVTSPKIRVLRCGEDSDPVPYWFGGVRFYVFYEDAYVPPFSFSITGIGDKIFGDEEV